MAAFGVNQSIAGYSARIYDVVAMAAGGRGEQALEWLADIGLPARLVGVDGAVYRINGWMEDGVESLSRGTT